jgi:hypothetical protein
MERDMAELSAIVDEACEILRRTNDGDDLDPQDLYLSQCAVNGHLTEYGLEVFDKLHKQVLEGSYTKPYLHDVENMTRDHEGYIYYKERQVEHYSRDYVYSLEAKRDLTELKNQCEYLERKGTELSSISVIWGWDNHKDAYTEVKLDELNSVLDGSGITLSYVTVNNNYGKETKYLVLGVPDLNDVERSSEYKDFADRNDNDNRGYSTTVTSYHYGGETETTSDAALALLPSCFEHMRDTHMLSEVGTQNYETERDNAQDNEQDNESEQDDDLEDDDEEEMEG